MKQLLVIMAIVLSLTAYHLFIVDKYYVRASSISMLDINALLASLEDDLYATRISAEEFKIKTNLVRNNLNKESGIVLSSTSVVVGINKDLTADYMHLVK